MSGPFGSSQWMYSSGGFYDFPIEQSLRFNDDDNAYLSRNFTYSPRYTQTFSFWVKRCNLSSDMNVLGAYDGSSNFSFRFTFTSSDQLLIRMGGANATGVTTSQVFRDTSSWYHIVVAIDTTDATSTNRIKLYVNGEQITSFSSASYPSLNANSQFGSGSANNKIGAEFAGNFRLDGYLAEVNFIDGQALDASSFGEFKSGVWIPKDPSGLTYGTNGFRLSFADSSNIGDDTSGNTNDWTASGLVATDVLLDSPTNNFAVWNAINNNTTITLSEGNLVAETPTTGVNYYAQGSFVIPSGKFYFEGLTLARGTGSCRFGISSNNSVSTSDIAIYNATGTYQIEGTDTSGKATYGVGDVIGCAVDTASGTIEFFKNNVSQGSVSISASEWTPHLRLFANTFVEFAANFGQDSSFAGNKPAQGNTDDNGYGDFYYAPPSGYLALCTANLPDPVIDPAQDDVPSDYFNTVLYTGDGTSSRSITGVGFQPDLAWIKTRSTTGSNWFTDAIRGTTKILASNLTNAEATVANTLTSFNSDGFSVGDNAEFNGSGRTLVAWNWLAGNGTSSNTDGSITSTVSVNQKAGFSIASYTGNGVTSGESIGHGLSQRPDMVIVKNRTSATGWDVLFPDYMTATQYMALNSTNAITNSANSGWGGSLPDSTKVYVGGSSWTNTSGDNYIAYCFHSVEGYSKFGSYTGNGSNDGPFIYCGFRPAWVLIKRTDSTSNWSLIDDARYPSNTSGPDNPLRPNTSEAESGGSDRFVLGDMVSNGFKLRYFDASTNVSGASYIYMAFAEMPAKYSLGR